MGKKTKTTTNQTQNQNFSGTQTSTVHDSPDIQAYRNAVNNPVDLTQSVVHGFAGAEDAIRNQRFETDLPEGVREQIKIGQLFNLGQERANALANAKFASHFGNTQNLGNLANLTAGRTTTSSGNSYGTMYGTSETKQPFNWGGFFGDIAKGAIGGALMN